MPLKQSAFNFDFIPEENSPEPALPVMQEPEVMVNEPVRPAVLRIKQLKTVAKDEVPVKSARGRMKLSDMNALADKIEVPDDKELFEKSYYSIGAVSTMFKVNQSLIRY